MDFTMEDASQSPKSPPDNISIDEVKAARRRREKPQLSCSLCRTRKYVDTMFVISRKPLTYTCRNRLRCDRQQPCHNCVHRGLAETCACAHAKIPRSKTTQSDGSPQLPPTVRDRVKQLEDQVVSLMGALNGTPVPAQAGVSTGTTAQSIRSDSNGAPGDLGDLAPPVPGSPGYMEYTPSAVNYIGTSHWLSILGNVWRSTTAKPWRN